MPFQAFERALARVAPGVALKRAKSRRAFSRLDSAHHGLGFSSGSYEAGSMGRRTQGWRARRTDGNAALENAIGTLRARSRDLVRNNPWASAGLDTLEEFTVGTGIAVAPIGSGREVQAAKALWESWATEPSCDADGQDDLAGLQALIMRTVVESGSCLIRRRIRTGPERDSMPLPLQLQILEPDHLDHTRTTGDGRNRVIQGVEVNAIGRRVAYWLFRDHPGSSHPTTMRTESVRVPASEVLHVYRRTRAGSMDGAPWLTPAIMRSRSLDEFEDAELLRMVVASSWAGFVTRETDPDDAEADQDDAIEEVQPGAIEYLRPGEGIEFPTVPDVSGRESYVATQLRAIAAAYRVPYEALTQDLTKVNFSSGRMGFNAFEKRIAKWRKQMLVGQFLKPVWGWFLEAALAEVKLPASARNLQMGWTPPGSLVLDPDKEGKADFAAIRHGTKTISEVLRSRGKDPRTHLEEAAADFELLDELGLVLDSDPRRVVAAGSGQAAGAPGADEADGEDEPEEADQEESPEDS